MHSFKGFKRIILVALLAFISVLSVACSQSSGSQTNSVKSGELKVVTTTDFYGEVAKAVVGNKGEVTSIINKPNVDPHDYEPTTGVAKKVSQANVTIANGIGYDGWMNKLAANAKNATNIKAGEDIMGKKSGDNPHLWYNPETMPKLANYLAAKLGKLQPKNKQYFAANAKKYIQSLKPVNDEIAKVKTIAAKATNKKVYVSEPVFDYALQALGFQVANKEFEEATEKETDPSPKIIQEMKQNINDKKIALFVFNKQVDSKTVNEFVKQAKAKDIPVLSVTETLPAGKTYTEWMLSQYKDLSNILNK